MKDSRKPVGHKNHNEDEIVLDLLQAVEGNASITQRDLARELGIALGLANAYMRTFVRKGLLKVSEAPSRRYAYYLTPKGFAEKSRLTARYLSVSFSFLRLARQEFEEIFSRAARRSQFNFLLLGEGDLADVAKLVASHSNANIIDTVSALAPEDALASIATGKMDAIIVTAMEAPDVSYVAALRVYGKQRVYAPGLLRITEASHEADDE